MRRTKNIESLAYDVQGGLALDFVARGPATTDKAAMSATCVFSTNAIDRVGDRISIPGINTANHQLNPVVFWDHAKAITFPIGRTMDAEGRYSVLLTENEAIQTTYFSQKLAVAEQVFWLIDEKIVSANSIGFRQLKAMPLYIGGRRLGLDLLETELLEVSWVGVGCNPEAVRRALAREHICGKSLDSGLRLSLSPWAEAPKAWSNGFTAKSLDDAATTAIAPAMGEQAQWMDAMADIVGGLLLRGGKGIKGWEADKHPRGQPGNAGQFGSGGGGKKPAKDKPKPGGSGSKPRGSAATSSKPKKPAVTAKPAAAAKLRDGRQVQFVPHRNQRPDETTVMVDPRKVDQSWRNSGTHLPSDKPGASEVAGRRDAVERFLATGKPVEASRGSLTDGQIDLEDGRHRLAVLRDAGANLVAITVPKEQAKEIVDKFGPSARTPSAPRAAGKQSQQAASKAIETILSGAITPTSHKELVGHLSRLTVPQLHELRKQHGLECKGKLKAQVLERLATHFNSKIIKQGTVNVDQVAAALKPFDKVKLDLNETRFAKADYLAIKEQYQTLTVQRIKELSVDALKGMQGLPAGSEERDTFKKKLAIYSWMCGQAKRDGITGKVEPSSLNDFAANLDRVTLGERLKGTPWTAFLIRSVMQHFGIDDEPGGKQHVAAERTWNALKEGKYKGPTLDAALRSLRADYGTMNQQQLFRLLPHLKERSDAITPEIVAKVTAGKKSHSIKNVGGWSDADHPRGQPNNAGQFGPGGGGKKPAADDKPASGKKPEASGRHATVKKIAGHFSESLRSASHIPAAQRKAYASHAAEVLKVMPAAALDKVQGHLKSINWHADAKQLTGWLAERSPKVKAAMAKGSIVAGAVGSDGSLQLDGGTKKFPIAQAYAHEITHLVDGPDHKISGSKAWLAAFAEEIKPHPDRISKYATTEPAEGFAEFGRLVYGLKTSPAELKKTFPKCAAIWESQGLLPAENKAALTKPPELFSQKIELEKGGHADMLKAAPVVAPETRTALRKLIDLGKKVGHLEHAAQEYIGKQVARLPSPLRIPVVGAYKIAFASYTVAQAAVKEVAAERGFTPEQIDHVAKIAGIIDVVGGGKVFPGVLKATGLGAAAFAGSFVPVGSLGYLAYSTARDPAATLRVAKKAVAAAAKKLRLTKAMPTSSTDLMEILLSHVAKAKDPDAWMANYLAALDAAGGDAEKAIAIVGEIFGEKSSARILGSDATAN